MNIKHKPESFRKNTRLPLRISVNEMVKAETLSSAGLPLLITPCVPEFDPISYASHNVDQLQKLLSTHGGLLFRGANVNSASQFEAFVEASCGCCLEYRERSSPRTKVTGNIYTSTEYPPHKRIPFHNENSYQKIVPKRIAFYCELPAKIGGETPIADCRRIYQGMLTNIRDKFVEKGLLYVRHFNSGCLGLPWEEVFQTNDKELVTRYCRSVGIESEWLANGALKTKQRRAAVMTHPETGEIVWFNHSLLFHKSTLAKECEEGGIECLSEEELPNSCYYGDGGEISEGEMDEVRRCYADAAFEFKWQKGDVLLLDNLLVSHARNRFEGPRKVLVAMSMPFDRNC